MHSRRSYVILCKQILRVLKIVIDDLAYKNSKEKISSGANFSWLLINYVVTLFNKIEISFRDCLSMYTPIYIFKLGFFLLPKESDHQDF